MKTKLGNNKFKEGEIALGRLEILLRVHLPLIHQIHHYQIKNICGKICVQTLCYIWQRDIDIHSHINLPKAGIIIPTSQTETEIS